VVVRAAALAIQQARRGTVATVESVRVWGLDQAPGVAAAVADAALGPFEATAIDPGGRWAAAWPTAEGVPLVGEGPAPDSASAGPVSDDLPAVLWGERTRRDETLFLARCLILDGPLERAHDRAAPFLARKSRGRKIIRLLPAAWRRARATAYSDGLALEDAVAVDLADRCRALGLESPRPLSTP
jgi:hypothetical protein